MNKKIFGAIIAIVAISIAGTVALYALSPNNSVFPFNGIMVLQSDVTGVNVTILGPEETLKTGVIGDSGELTFTGLPEGNYQAIAAKEALRPYRWDQHKSVLIQIYNNFQSK